MDTYEREIEFQKNLSKVGKRIINSIDNLGLI